MKTKILISLALLFCMQAFTQSLELSSALPFDKDVRTGSFSNGLKYYIRKNARPEKRAELRLVVNVGSTSEDDDQQGLAHFCEHMAFNGTENFEKNELVNYLESIGTKFGPHLNAYTSFDETVYMLRIPTDDPKFVSNGMQILEDWAHGCSYDNAEIDKERGVVTEEWRLGQGASKRMMNKTYPVYFMGSRYADRLPIGKREIIQNAPYERLKSFYTDWYRPDNMAVILIGDFNLDEMEQMIRKHFEGLKNPSGERKVQSYQVPDHDDLRIAVATDKEASNTNVQVAYFHDNQNIKTIADYREQMIHSLYNSMLGSRLQELTRLSDPPFIFGYTSFGSMVRTKSSYSSYVSVKDTGIERGLQTILEENERVKRFGFTTSELEREKKAVMREMEKALAEKDKSESVNYTYEYIQHFLKGSPSPGIEFEMELYKKYLNGISLDEVNVLAKKWILDGGKNCTVTITGPDKPEVKIPDDNAIRAIFTKVSKAEIKPYVDTFVDQPLMAKLPTKGSVKSRQEDTTFGTTKLTLSNGVNVILKKTDFKNDQVLFTATSFGGMSLVPDKDYMTANYASWILQNSGIGPFNQDQFGKYMAAKFASVNASIRDTQEGMSGSASPTDIETMMQLIYLRFTAPRHDEEAITSSLEKQKSMLKNRGADPRSAYTDSIQLIQSNYHFRKRPASLQTLDEVNTKELSRVYKERFANAGDFTFVFVGNFDEKLLIDYIEQYIASLPSNSMKEKCADPGIDYPKKRIEKTVYRGIEPKSEVTFIFSGKASYTENENLVFQSLQKLMQTKLRESLREENGGTYGVGCYGSISRVPTEQFSLTINFSCAPENVEKLSKATQAVITEVQKNGCTEEDLVKIRETFIRERETNLKENYFWMNRLMNSALYGDSLQTDVEFDAFFASLKSEDLKNAANAYFNMEVYSYYLWLPETK